MYCSALVAMATETKSKMASFCDQRERKSPHNSQGLSVQASQAAFSPLSLNPFLGHYGHSYQDLMFDTPILSPSPPTCTVLKNTFYLHATAKGRWSYLKCHAMDC